MTGTSALDITTDFNCRPIVPRIRCAAANSRLWGKVSKFMTSHPLTSDEVSELVSGLEKLARNLWWTWDQNAQEVFQELSPRGWQNLYHNAVAILHEVSDYELRVRLQSTEFGDRVR